MSEVAEVMHDSTVSRARLRPFAMILFANIVCHVHADVDMAHITKPHHHPILFLSHTYRNSFAPRCKFATGTQADYDTPSRTARAPPSPALLQELHA